MSDYFPPDQAYPTTRLDALLREVDGMPPPRDLVRGLIASDDYGVIGAEWKLGKSFLVADLVANVAGGGRFLGKFECDTPGPVLLFAGEGGKRKLARRFRAVCEHYQLDPMALPVEIHEKAPRLAKDQAVARLEATVAEVQPVLVVIDPAYLAIAGASSSNLEERGELFQNAQHAVQDNSAAVLMFTHHWNKTGTTQSFSRIAGAGFAEWARFMGTASLKSKTIDSVTKASTAVVALETLGDEIPGDTIVYRRRIWVDDVADRSSPMHYEVQVLEDASTPDAPEGVGKNAARVLAVLRAALPEYLDYQQIGDGLASTGMPFKKSTIFKYLEELEALDLVDRTSPGGNKRDLFGAVEA